MRGLPHTQNIVIAKVYKVIFDLLHAPLEAFLLMTVGVLKLKHFTQCSQVDAIALLTELIRRFYGGSTRTGLFVLEEGRGLVLFCFGF